MGGKLMNVWRFYKKPEKGVSKRKYELYALTNHKEYAEVFMDMRDMDQFIMKCSKEDKETYADFANSHRDNVLELHSLTTKVILENGVISQKEVDVILTLYEYMTCNSDEYMDYSINDSYWWDGIPSYLVYKDDLQKALKNLEYIFHYKTYAENPLLKEEDDDYSSPNLWMDEVGIFVRVFGHTFK